MNGTRKAEYYLSVIKQHKTLKQVVSVFPFLATILNNRSLTFRANNQDGICYIDALGTEDYYNIIANINHPDESGSLQLYTRHENDKPKSFIGPEDIRRHLNGEYDTTV